MQRKSHATGIAPDRKGAGFVTKFEVEQSYVERFEVQTVGNRSHQELWVPAEELEEFNRHIVGVIVVEAAFYGEKFTGELDPDTNLPRFTAE